MVRRLCVSVLVLLMALAGWSAAWAMAVSAPKLAEVGPGGVKVSGRLVPETDDYSRLVDSLKSGTTVAVVQYAMLERSGGLAGLGVGRTAAAGERTFTLRYVPAENVFKVAVPGQVEGSVTGESTLQELMFDVRNLPLRWTGRPLPCKTLRMGVSWQAVEAESPTWLKWITLMPLWQRVARVEGTAGLEAGS